MTIIAGPWEYGGGNGMRVGVETTVSAVTSGSASVTFTYKTYTENQYNYNDLQTLLFSGSYSGAGTYDYNNTSSTGSGWVLRTTKTYTFTYATWGTSPGSTSFGAAVSGAYNGTTPSLTVSTVIPARPYAAPSAPTGVAAARVSDTTHTVSWTRVVSSSAPYTSQKVQRSTDGGAWVTVATLSGTVTSYSDSSTVADHDYQWRVQGINSAGTATSAVSAHMQTSPAAPASVGAVKTMAGDVTVTWVNTSRLSPITYRVQDSPDGSTWTDVASGLTAVTWTHTVPSTAVTHRYRVRAESTEGASTQSAWSPVSPIIQLLAAPNAPTGLGPATVQDGAADIALTWVHVPVDSTPQTGFSVRHRLVGAGSWTTVGPVTSGVSSWTLPAGTYANGTQFEWQVQTKGTHASYSPWSDVSVVTLSARPTVTVNAPGATWDQSALVVTWGYYDPETTAQSAWEVDLLASGVVVESASGAGDAASATLATVLPNGSSWTVRVRAADTLGVWSDYDSQAFAVAYAPPPTPVVTLTWDSDTASVVVGVDTPDTAVGEVDAVYVDLYRAIDDGAWTLIATGVPPDASVADRTPTVAGLNRYRATAVSASPSTATSADVELTTPVAGDPGRVWLNGGPGYETGCSAGLNVEVDHEVGAAEKVLRRYSGRLYPVEHVGEGLTESWSVSWDVVDAPESGSLLTEWAALVSLPGPHMLRTPDGIRVLVSAGTVRTRRGRGGVITGAAVTVERTA